MRKTLGLILLSLVLVALAFWQRDALRQAMFERTGEEDLLPQVRGMAQYAANITRRPPRTDPYVLAEHAGVNPFGINTFWQLEADPEKRVQQAQLISNAGFRWIRQEFTWEDIEIAGRGDFVDRRNDPDGIDAWAKYDHIVQVAGDHDLEIIARLSNPPAWSRAAGDEVGPQAPPDDVRDYAAFASAVAERYQGQIRYYQLWNEPNIYPEWGENDPDPEAYVELLCEGYQAIKEVDPGAVVLSGALAATSELSGRNLNDYVYLERLYAAGGGECFDVLSMQGYGLWSGPTDHRREAFVVNYGRVEFIRDIMLRHGDGDKAIWISEMNWNVAPEDVAPDYGRVTLDQQARWAPLAYQRAQEEWPYVGVVNFWYFRRPADDWEQAGRPEAYFRMATPDFELQPVYHTMADYMQQQPVLYAGAHAPDHWAVAWSESDDDRAVARLTFEGTALDLLLSEGVGGEVCLDGSAECTPLTANTQPTPVWRSIASSTHTAELRLDDAASLQAIIVREADLSPLWVVAIGLAAGLTFARIRRSTRA